MKKFLLVFILILSVSSVSAQDSGSGNNTNFRFHPIPFLIGILLVDLDFKVSSEWTLGPTLAYMNWDRERTAGFNEDFEIKASQIGIRANWFNSGVYTDGLYVAPMLKFISAEATGRDDSNNFVSASGSVLAAECIVGYGWFWNSFNMLLGGGLILPIGDNEVIVKDAAGTTTEEIDISNSFAIEYSLGWTF